MLNNLGYLLREKMILNRVNEFTEETSFVIPFPETSERSNTDKPRDRLWTKYMENTYNFFVENFL